MTHETTMHASLAGTWRLGDHTVARMGFGAMRLMARNDGSPVDRDQAISVLRRAVDLGVNHIDTASFYFHSARSANELINSALSPYPDDVLIATKVGPSRDAGGSFQPEARPEELRGQVEENLRQLGRDHLDLVNLRIGTDLDIGTGSLADRFAALVELRDAGLIRHLGISNVKAEHLAEATAIAPVACVQNLYNITRRDDDGLVDRCAEQGIAYVPFFPLGGHQLPSDERITAVARRHAATTAEVILAWTLRRAPNILLVPGTGDPDHLEHNIAAAGLDLSKEDYEELDSIARSPSEHCP